MTSAPPQPTTAPAGDLEAPGPAEPPLPGRRLPRPLSAFLHTESASGIVLLVAATVALVWANSPWQDSYADLLHLPVDVGIGDFRFAEDLHHAVNDGLMALFFFVVGLEIKRELVAGELRSPRSAALPAIAALGGMVVPAAVFLAVTAGGPGASGWAIPMATDIAFAIGVVSLLGDRVPAPLKLFLLTLAIVDDIGAIVIIAVVFTDSIDPVGLGVAAAAIATVVALRRADVVWRPAFVIAGLVLWVGVFASGVHATLAGVVMGLLTPARPRRAADVARDWADDLLEDPSAADVEVMQQLARATVSEAEWLQHKLHPLTSFVVIPVFALMNAGVTIDADALASDGAWAVVAGVALGLVVGKLIGVVGATWVAAKAGVAPLPAGAGLLRLAGVGASAGIGFTVSLFLAALAFDDPTMVSAAKIGILGGSLVASGLATLLFTASGRRVSASRPPAPAAAA